MDFTLSPHKNRSAVKKLKTFQKKKLGHFSQKNLKDFEKNSMLWRLLASVGLHKNNPKNKPDLDDSLLISL